jgi:hypothetical protein
VIEISNSDAFVCLRQRGSADGSEPQPRRNRRTSIGKSPLAQKWNSQRRAMAIQFQALHFSLYGPEFRHEACHRKLNLELIVDAMRRVLNKEDKEEFREFVNDVNAENNVPNQLDGMRYKSAQKFTNEFTKVVFEHFRTRFIYKILQKYTFDAINAHQLVYIFCVCT